MGLFDGFKGGEPVDMGIRSAIKAELDRREWSYEENEESDETRKEAYFYMRNELENDEPVTRTDSSRSRSMISPISRKTGTARSCSRSSMHGTPSIAL